MPRHITQASPKARKDHNCNFCNNTIDKGTVYNCVTYSFDGIIYNWKTHRRCSLLATRLNLYENYSDYGGLTDQGFTEGIRENFSIRFPHSTENNFSKIMMILHEQIM